jgi:twitching motility protein PilT
MLDLDSILHFMVHVNASDLHVKIGAKPTARIDGELVATNFERATSSDISFLIEDGLGELSKDFWEKEIVYSLPGFGRFRASIYRQRGTFGIVFTRVLTEVRSLTDLGFSGEITRIKNQNQGLYILSSSLGMGLSSTFASVIDDINESSKKNIIMIEDPIEILIKDKASLVIQREVGSDVPSIEEGLRKSLRNDPDVIAISNINNSETMYKALMAAEGGQLVIVCVRGLGIIETLSNVMSLFLFSERQTVLNRLNRVLKGVFSQSLLDKVDRDGRIPISESLFINGDFDFNEVFRPKSDYQNNSSVLEFKSFEDTAKVLIDRRIIEEDPAKGFIPDEVHTIMGLDASMLLDDFEE